MKDAYEQWKAAIMAKPTPKADTISNVEKPTFVPPSIKLANMVKPENPPRKSTRKKKVITK